MCRYGDTGELVATYPRVWEPVPTTPTPVIELTELALWAIDQVSYETPAIELSPAAQQIVGVETWLSITNDLELDQVTAQAGPIWVTARPELTQISWDLGNGDTVTCAAQAAAITWDPNGGPNQTTPCGYTYTTNGDGTRNTFTIAATASYNIYVTTSSNPTETLHSQTTQTATINTEVRELQAVINR